MLVSTITRSMSSRPISAASDCDVLIEAHPVGDSSAAVLVDVVHRAQLHPALAGKPLDLRLVAALEDAAQTEHTDTDHFELLSIACQLGLLPLVKSHRIDTRDTCRLVDTRGARVESREPAATVAGHGVVALDAVLCIGAAVLHMSARQPAAGVEPAPRRRRRAGWASRPTAPPPSPGPAARMRGTAASRPCVYGCTGSSKICLRRARLDELPEVHHRDAVGDLADDVEVVGDDQVGHAELMAKVVHQRQHARRGRHVETRCRLVGHDQVRLAARGRGRC